MSATASSLARALCCAVVVAPLSAWATTVNAIPEPGIWSLLGLAGAAAAIITIRNRRK